MKRLVETSAGRIELDLSKLKIGGLNVRVSLFGDDGWDTALHVWSAQWSENETLADLLERKVGLSPHDAERIASETLEQWRTRGGEEEDDGRSMIAYLGTTFGLAALGLIALIAFVAWLVT